jgi:acetoin utilization protein AcuB
MARLLESQGADALRQALATPIVEVMTSDVISVEPDTEVGDVIGLLIDRRIGALPVIDVDTREVLGIISYVDVLRALQSVLDEEV